MDIQLEQIKELRKKVGLTQYQLSQKAGVSQSLIAKIESGRIDPAYTKVKKIIDTLNNLNTEKSLKAKDLMNKKIISIKPEEKVQTAIKKMREHGISQLPIIEKENVIGLISEESILDIIKEGKSIDKLSAKEVMVEDPPIIPEETPISGVTQLLKFHSLILIKKKGKVVGLLTKADVLKML